MSGMLPEGDPPEVSPLLRPLLEEPCRRCGSSRLFAEHLTQEGIPEVGGLPLHVEEPPDDVAVSARYRLHVLCGNCGLVDERTGWQRGLDVEQADDR